jgi:hypothetical protein
MHESGAVVHSAILAILALRSQRQKDFEFRVSLDYTGNLYLKTFDVHMNENKIIKPIKIVFFLKKVG